MTLTVGYDIKNVASADFRGETVTDTYGRKIPKHAHGTANLPRKTSSVRCITDAVLGIYDSKVEPKLTVRRLTITANRLVGEDTPPHGEQIGGLSVCSFLCPGVRVTPVHKNDRLHL